MKMAKASTADMEMAMKLCSALEAMDRRFFPEGAEGEHDPEDFDCDDDAHCGQALRHVIDILQGGSIGRVIWGMYVMLDPENKVVDPDADTLEEHPETVAAMKDRERMDWLADPENGIGNVQLPAAVVHANVHSLRDAIDAAMDLPSNVRAQGREAALPAKRPSGAAGYVHAAPTFQAFPSLVRDNLKLGFSFAYWLASLNELKIFSSLVSGGGLS